MIDKDATAAFDWVLPALAIVTCQRLGLPKVAGEFPYHLLLGMEFQVGAAHGISHLSYKAAEVRTNPGQGSGQGTGSAPTIYGTTGDVTIAAYKRHSAGAVIVHPLGREPPQVDHARPYIDDATGTLNYAGALVMRFGRALQDVEVDALTWVATTNFDKWCKYVWTSGGAVNMEKCFGIAWGSIL